MVAQMICLDEFQRTFSNFKPGLTGSGMFFLPCFVTCHDRSWSLIDTEKHPWISLLILLYCLRASDAYPANVRQFKWGHGLSHYQSWAICCCLLYHGLANLHVTWHEQCLKPLLIDCDRGIQYIRVILQQTNVAMGNPWKSPINIYEIEGFSMTFLSPSHDFPMTRPGFSKMCS